MSYAEESRRAGRKPITLAELDFERCAQTYGSAPCTAAVGVTGETKCYNTRSTCQDAANFDSETSTLLLCEARSDLPVGLNAIPCIKGVSTAPTKLDIGGGLGQRSSASLSLQDFTHHDRGFDPYIADRVAPAQGTFWGRFRARNPYYYGRICRIKTGYLTDAGLDEANLVTRTYVIESFAGPDLGGKVQITVKGLLKLADDERAQAPAPSSGVLLAGIDVDDTAATLSPSGIGAAEYPSSGFVRLGSEVCEFTRSGDSLTLTRGQWNTQASPHDVNETAQLCLEYDSERLDDICSDLLITYAGVPAGYIPSAEWSDEVDTYLPRAYSARITEPTGVKQLLTELVQQAPFYLWDDERSAEIKLRAIRGPEPDSPILSDASHFIAGSLSIGDKPDQWISQVWVYIGQIDPTEALDKTSNYRQLVIAADPASEAVETYNRKSVRKVYSRWLSSKAAAQDLGNQLIDRFGETPRQVQFTLDAKDYTWWTGDVMRLQTRLAQAVDGSVATLTAQIIEAAESQVAHQFKYTALAFRYSTPSGLERVITISEDTLDFNLLTAYTVLYGAPTSPVTVTCIVEIDVKVGSSLTSGAAWVLGDFPEGSTLKLENNGRIQGAGGEGLEIDGLPGGPALQVGMAITVDNPGEIFGGGGGGAGEQRSTSDPMVDDYTSGGGGAGYVPGESQQTSIHPSFFPGYAGTTEAGGAGGTDTAPGTAGSGGGPGLPGDNTATYVGGAAGNAVVGDSFITWLSTGDIRGPVV